ncbi:hypothetical protein J6590_098540 [Homalodisca vitripennis]|nr:hypothetical protein J6590_029325 [Homalodisca vitripennis]KAG8289725.1 hypothetical protein J6590_098540 [Homalodisca vitripennis]
MHRKGKRKLQLTTIQPQSTRGRPVTVLRYNNRGYREPILRAAVSSIERLLVDEDAAPHARIPYCNVNCTILHRRSKPPYTDHH